MGIITLLTDFGIADSYVSQMKAVILSIADTRIIDITHEIKPQDINEGAFVLQNVVKYFPIGTVHVAVVDPEVGSNRKGIIVTTINQIFVGPDNGLLIPAARNLGDFIVYEIKNEKYMLNSISSTFHGRDIFSPVAAYIINGIPFEKIGKRIKNFVNLDFKKGKIENRLANGKILHIDKFGNITTNIDGIAFKKFIKFDNKIIIYINEKKLNIPFVKSYNYVKKRHFLATIGSSNLFEIAINQGNAANKLNVKPYDKIKIIF